MKALAVALLLPLAAVSPAHADDNLLVANPDWVPEPAGEEEAEDEAEARMSLDEIPQASDTIARWGVVAQDCPVFSRDGKRFSEKAYGGTLVEIEKFTRTSKREEMAFCHLRDGESWAGPFLLPAKSLVVFAGTRAGVKADDLASLVEYCRLEAALARREATLEKEAVDANPYAARVRELAEGKKAMARRTKVLTEERDQATGPERNAIADELRRLQIETATLTRMLNEQVALYESWKSAHPGACGVSKADDPEWRELDARRRALAPAVRMFDLSGQPVEAP